NEVSYAYYSGISIGFGWTKAQTAMTNNHVNWNEIHHIARLLCDSGPIYTLSNQGTGSEIQHNYIHDNGTSKWADYWNVPIYLDEGSSGFTVKENVFKNSPAGVGQNQAGQNNLQQSNNYYSDDVVNNAGIEKEFRYIRDIKEIPLADFSNTVTQEAFKAIMSISGTIQVEDYDLGGQSVSFYDKDFVNEGNVYRDDGVDVVGFGCSDSAMTQDCKGYAIGYTQAGEWLEYSVNVVTASKYLFRANVATGLEGGSFRLFLDGKAVTDTIAVPQGEDWNTYSTVDGETAELEKGDHVLKIQFTGSYVNMDWIKFALTSQELETTGLKVAQSRLNLNERGYDVFGMDGSYICRIDGMVAKGGFKAALTARGLNPGVYVVRGLDSHRSVKVNMVK
ncbi:MAG: carbohydrate-binding protein, partial [Fibrobacter sp.]|nr:carbohydrate-binding protein [Fibrobacter sp.]